MPHEKREHRKRAPRKSVISHNAKLHAQTSTSWTLCIALTEKGCIEASAFHTALYVEILREHAREAHELGIECFLVVDGVKEIDRDDLALLEAEHDVRRAGNQRERRLLTEHGGLHAVLDRRRAAALDMTEHGDARVNARLFLDDLAEAHAVACALGDHDDAVTLTGRILRLDVLAHLIEVVLDLRHEHVLRAARDAGLHGEPAGLMPHDLDDHDAAVRRRRIAQLVERVDDRIGRRVAADRVVRAPDIVVDRAGKPHDGDARLLREQRAAREAAVAADDDEALDAALLEVLIALAASLRRLELRAARRPEERAAALDDVADAAARELDNIVLEHTVIAVLDAIDLHALIERRAHDSARRRVHARAVAAGRHDGNRFFNHFYISPVLRNYLLSLRAYYLSILVNQR